MKDQNPQTDNNKTNDTEIENVYSNDKGSNRSNTTTNKESKAGMNEENKLKKPHQ